MTDCTGGVTDGDGQCTSPTPNQEICAAACQWVLLSFQPLRAGRACLRALWDHYFAHIE
jgi:hypothetical protein